MRPGGKQYLELVSSYGFYLTFSNFCSSPTIPKRLRDGPGDSATRLESSLQRITPVVICMFGPATLKADEVGWYQTLPDSLPCPFLPWLMPYAPTARSTRIAGPRNPLRMFDGVWNIVTVGLRCSNLQSRDYCSLGTPPPLKKAVSWTLKVCKITAFYRFWAINFPTFGGLGSDCIVQTHR